MLRKLFLIIADGVADRCIEPLGGATPLEAAVTPNLDYLAVHGQQGLMHIIDDQIAPESDNGAMALLSYDPLLYYTGRGPLEGLGTGFPELGRYSASFRVNFASFDPSRQFLERRTARDLDDSELQELTSEIRNGIQLRSVPEVKFEILTFRHHRGIITFYSDISPLDGAVSNTDPGFTNVGAFSIPVKQYEPTPRPCRSLNGTTGSLNIAQLVNEFSLQAQILLSNSIINKRREARGQLPANLLLFRDGGSPPVPLEQFQVRFGKTLSFYGQIPAEHGLVKLVGGRFTNVLQPSSVSEGDFLAQTVQTILNDPSDVIAIHILKNADEAGHGNDPHGKVVSIENFDRFFIGQLLPALQEHDCVIVTCDHATPCELGIHSSDPVPVVVFGAGLEPDTQKQFGERNAKHGALPVRSAKDLLPFVIRHAELQS